MGKITKTEINAGFQLHLNNELRKDIKKKNKIIAFLIFLLICFSAGYLFYYFDLIIQLNDCLGN